MSNTKHTPGPWKIRETLGNEGDFIITTDTNMATNYHIAQVWNVNGYGENTANASLIAAAPDLLELVQLVYGSFGGGLVITFSEADVEKFRAIIAKATGTNA